MASDYEDWATKYLDIRSLSYREANIVCPFHLDHAPSLRFNLDSGLWVCHGCHETGNIQKMAGKLGVSLPENDSVTVDDLALKIEKLVNDENAKTERLKERGESWLNQFTVNEDDIMEFWKRKRDISRSVINEFRLGYDVHNDAATIPIRGEVGYLGVVRRFNGPHITNRYLNPTNFHKSEHLLFLEKIDGSTVAVVEGPIDALRLWSVGIPAVSVFGSTMSSQHVSLLKRWGVNTVVSFFDNDAPGKVGTMKNDQQISGSGMMHYTVDWERHRDWSGSDPGSVTSREIRVLYRNAVPFFKWRT